MARSSSPLVREEGSELANDTLNNISHIDATDASTNSSPPEDQYPQECLKLLKSPKHRLDKRSPVLQDSLPGYDNFPGSTDAEFDNDPSSLAESTYPTFESGRSRLSGDWLQLLQDGNKRYAFRDTDRNTFRGSGFQDLDKSGNYVERPERLVRPQKIKIREITKASELWDGDFIDQATKRHQPRTLSYEQGRKNGRSMMLRLNVSSERGIESFKALAREHPSSSEAFDEVPQGDNSRSLIDSAYCGSKSPLNGRIGVTTRRSAVNVNDKTHDQ